MGPMLWDHGVCWPKLDHSTQPVGNAEKNECNIVHIGRKRNIAAVSGLAYLHIHEELLQE